MNFNLSFAQHKRSLNNRIFENHMRNVPANIRKASCCACRRRSLHIISKKQRKAHSTQLKFCIARSKNVFNQSADLFTLSVINKDTTAIENEEKTLVAVGKSNAFKELVLQVLFRCSKKIFTFSGSR